MNREHFARTILGGKLTTTALSVLLALALGACDGSDLPTGDESPAALGVHFQVATNQGAAASGHLSVEGTNGTLTITELAFIVEEFELEGTQGTEDFERDATFLDALLAGPVIAVSSREIPPGRYDELEFDIQDVDDDDEVLSEIRVAHPDWPEDASIRVAGTFQPQGGDAREFVVYLAAEVEIELDLVPPLVIEELEEEVLLVTLAPGLWFTRGDGSVLDLSEWQHISGQDLPELEVEIEGGFLEVEWDD